jgi:hypothetical protein
MIYVEEIIPTCMHVIFWTWKWYIELIRIKWNEITTVFPISLFLVGRVILNWFFFLTILLSFLIKWSHWEIIEELINTWIKILQKHNF